MRTRNGNLLATSTDVAKVTRITHAADGRVQVADPCTGNYGEIALPEYMFEQV